jgi:hypothetical protein
LWHLQARAEEEVRKANPATSRELYSQLFLDAVLQQQMKDWENCEE